MRKSENKEEAGAQKGREVAIHCVFPMVCGSGGSKSRLREAAGAEPFGQIKDKRWKVARRCGAKHISKSKCTRHTISGAFLEVEMSKKCTQLWREAHFQVKMYKAHHFRSTFGSWDVEKVHAVVARSTFPSQNVQNTILRHSQATFGSWDVEKVHAVVAWSTFPSQNVHNTPFPEHFWKLRCRKSARSCGAKHISKSKCTKHTILRHSQATFGSWDVEKVHAVVARSTFPSQNVQNTPFSDILRPLLEVEMSKKCGVVARSTFPSQNVQSTPFPEHFWKLRCRKSARSCGAKHISKSKCTKHTILRHSQATFGSWDVEKVHAVVARSTFPSQNVQNTPFREHFWKLRCRKSARSCGAKHFQVKMYKTHHSQTFSGHFWKLRCRKSVCSCGAKHISKSKCTQHTILRHSQATFGSWDVEKVHAVVARSTFPSQNVQNTPFSDILRPPLEVEMSKKCTQLWREAHFQVKMYKTHHSQTFSGHSWKLRCRKSARSCGAKHISKSKCTKHTILRHSQATFGSWDVEKVHAVVARSTFPSQNVQNTPFPEHFWKLRCRKSARSCGAKHISKSKCTKHTILRHSQATFGSWDVEKVHAVVARSTFPSQNVQNTPFSDILRPLFGSWDAEKLHAVVARSTFPSQNVQNTPFSDILKPLLEVETSKKCTQLWREAHFQVKMYKTHHFRSTFGSCDVEKVHAVVARSTFPSQNVHNTPFSDILRPPLEVEMSKKCTQLWREAHFQVKMYTTHHSQTFSGHLWKLRCRKSARSCGAKHFQVKMYKTHHSQTFSGHFWKLRCRKSARSCGAKHISKSKVSKTEGFGPLFDIQMSTKCTLLWCEAHFQVKSAKHWEVWTTFGRSDVGSRGRCKGLCTLSKVSKAGGFCSSFNYNHPYNTLQYTKLRYTTLHYTTLNYITTTTTTTATAAAPLHYITLHYTNYIQLHYTPLHSASFHPIPFHFATLQLQLRHLQLQPQLQLQLQYSYNYNYTTITTTALQLLTRATTSATPPTTLQLHHTTLRYNTLH